MESKYKELAGLMFDSVYPRLIELMGHANINSVAFQMKGYKKVIFNNKGMIQWMDGKDGDERVSFERDYYTFDKENKCPTASVYEGDIYIDYCNAMMDKITELENKVNIFNTAIDRARRIGVTCKRKILIEKTIKQ